MASDTSTITQPFDFIRDEFHTKQRGLWAQAFQRLIRNRLALVAGIILIGICTQIVVLFVGITIGMGAALGGKVSDGILMWFTDLTYAFPDLLAIILMRQVLLGRDWPIIGTGSPQVPGFHSSLLVTVLAI